MEISIKKPCHENWEAMTPTEQGAFCGKCVKTVIDFSSKSLDEIKQFFAGKQNEKICGRFETSQLTSLSFDAFFREFKGFNFTKRFAVILYFTFGMWLFGASSALAQTPEHVKGDIKVDHTIMGGVRAMPTDTTKQCTKPNPRNTNKAVKGKVAVIQQKPIEETVKMGEVEALPPKKEATKSQKPKPKNK
ncbi:MAG: hypothetical protein HY062_10135 [Bacteroidetes bacterium]|nr:hypothetical protein [Bacteroidota bacterium]